jgi:hypothetical protein
MEEPAESVHSFHAALPKDLQPLNLSADRVALDSARKTAMTLYVVLIFSAGFLGMFHRLRDGVYCGIALVLVLFALMAILPDSVLAAALQVFFPFSLYQ